MVITSGTLFFFGFFMLHKCYIHLGCSFLLVVCVITRLSLMSSTTARYKVDKKLERIYLN